MDTIAPLKKIRITEEVITAIENIIIDNELQPGDKLPSQLKLSQAFGVGSRSVREAVKALESRGLVETIHGKGVFVKNSNMDFFLEILKNNLAFHLPKGKKALIDLTNTRKIVETNVIHDIALDTPRGFISSFAALIDEMDRKIDENNIEAYNLLDVELHKMIIKATDNAIIISIYNHLFELLVRAFQKTGLVKGSTEKSRKEHRQMLEAITASDGERARTIMTRHINSTLEKLMKMQDLQASGSV